jgi:hypothetical protein
MLEAAPIRRIMGRRSHGYDQACCVCMIDLRCSSHVHVGALPATVAPGLPVSFHAHACSAPGYLRLGTSAQGGRRACYAAGSTRLSAQRSRVHTAELHLKPEPKAS